MDPLTHALTGAAVAYAAVGRAIGRRALFIGAAAGLAPDLDILIRSTADPLLAIEQHRGFTHSIAFALLGGTIAGFALGRRGARAAAILAWLSAALLDTATTYGTQLFWPFSRARIGLNLISVLDPLFTLTMLVAVIAAFAGRRGLMTAALLVAVGWLGAGLVQRERASSAQRTLASMRGHQPARGAVFPTMGNTILWRSIYRDGNMLHLDRIRVPWLGDATFARVESVPLATPPTEPRMRREFDRFAWFSDGWVAVAPTDPTVIGDARYSLRGDRYEPVWGIRFHAESTPSVEWVDRTRTREVSPGDLWREVTGRAEFSALRAK